MYKYVPICGRRASAGIKTPRQYPPNFGGEPQTDIKGENARNIDFP